MAGDDPRFERWVATLRTAAEQRDLGWLVAKIGESEREGFTAGLSPAEHLDSLENMAEWRGCGCTGA